MASHQSSSHQSSLRCTYVDPTLDREKEKQRRHSKSNSGLLHQAIFDWEGVELAHQPVHAVQRHHFGTSHRRRCTHARPTPFWAVLFPKLKWSSQKQEEEEEQEEEQVEEQEQQQVEDQVEEQEQVEDQVLEQEQEQEQEQVEEQEQEQKQEQKREQKQEKEKNK